jgi:hypothetical protein
MMKPLLCLSLWGVSSIVWAGDVALSGSIKEDIRYRLHDIPFGPWYAPVGLEAGFSRAETVLKGRVRARGKNVVAVADMSAVFDAFSGRLEGLEDLSQRQQVAPVGLEVNEAFIEVWDLGLVGLDLRMGHQVVQWGVGDQFNPTNNLNADDLEDSLEFGQQLPNLMVRADYALGPTWTLSGVLVPLFRPATLPRTAPMGVAALERLPMVEEEVRWKIQAEQALTREWSLLNYPTVVASVDPQMPATTLANMQGELRVGGSIGLQDIALSYYEGRSDIPQAGRNDTRLELGKACHPKRPNDCINGRLLTDVQLVYPRMRVLGFNGAGEFSPLSVLKDDARPFGWRLELAVVIPEHTVVEIHNAELPLGALTQPAGEYAYGLGGERPTVIEDRPFAKWTMGLDYTLSKNVYINGQWVHGLVDEFGAGDFISDGWVVRDGGVSGGIESTSDCVIVDESGKRCAWEMLRHRLGDYAVLGMDINMGNTLLRLFGLVDMSGYVDTRWDADQDRRVATRHGPFSANGFSAVLYPELSYNFGNGLVGGLGTVQKFGKPHTKFGDPAAGGDLFFTRGEYSF